MDEKYDKEHYIRVSEHHWVKKDNFHYFTEKDLIKRVAEKFGIREREVEDMYTLAMQYIKNKIEKPDNDYDRGYFLQNFGYFQKKNLIIDDLLAGRDTLKFKRAKAMLDSYVMRSQSRIQPK